MNRAATGFCSPLDEVGSWYPTPKNETNACGGENDPERASLRADPAFLLLVCEGVFAHDFTGRIEDGEQNGVLTNDGFHVRHDVLKRYATAHLCGVF